MINLEEATRKAKEYLGEAGFPTLALRLRGANRDDRNRWHFTFEHIFDPMETLHVGLDGETGEITEFRRERTGGR